ncbi:hypothetical protein LOC68_01320 [Blastopirellula sp. JC732]|uniref:Uncharacterized protein n=1 Tax=Blastopirellula sediminis TaxID=2894196 RepID=A0A9X1MKA9_9BACT|nr:hypothetical protein [Blastopirellula sediminis]MCC9608173.1 hypothetical protein [Blastopirellula sediminis]MCC9627034.1 hypothetical protein [Blastopirellula sediminis]
MQNWTQYADDEIYVIDLLQRRSGLRHIAPRHRHDQRDGEAVMTTTEHPGSVIKQFLRGKLPFDSVTTTDGTPFVLDAHHHWITLEEYEYFRSRNFSSEALADQNAPWVNGMPPLPAPI